MTFHSGQFWVRRNEKHPDDSVGISCPFTIAALSQNLWCPSGLLPFVVICHYSCKCPWPSERLSNYMEPVLVSVFTQCGRIFIWTNAKCYSPFLKYTGLSPGKKKVVSQGSLPQVLLSALKKWCSCFHSLITINLKTVQPQWQVLPEMTNCVEIEITCLNWLIES